MELNQRRAEAEAQLASLHQERGRAALDGQPFDSTAIVTLETEILALGDAEGEQARRDREAEAGERAKRIKALRAQLSDLEQDRLAAVAEADKAARAMADSIGRVLALSDQAASICHAVTGDPAPIPLRHPEVASRLAGRLSAIMSSIPGHRNRLGSTLWTGGSLYKATDDWRLKEAKLVAPHLEPLINKEPSHGNSNSDGNQAGNDEGGSLAEG